jgi:hypothetical protein
MFNYNKAITLSPAAKIPLAILTPFFDPTLVDTLDLAAEEVEVPEPLLPVADAASVDVGVYLIPEKFVKVVNLAVALPVMAPAVKLPLPVAAK